MQKIGIGDGRALAVEIKGSGVPVLLEVGAGGGGIGPAWNGIDDQIARFAKVIVYDRAGTGASASAQRQPTTGDRVYDLVALMDALVLREPVILVGWSLGGLIVQHFALLHPERVASLVLVDPTPDDVYRDATAIQLLMARASGYLLLLQARMGMLRRPRMRERLQKLIEVGFGPRFDRKHLPRLLDAVSEPALHRVTLMESAKLKRSASAVHQLMNVSGLPRVPLIVLSAGYRGRGASSAIQQIRDAHARLAASANGELRELSNISHHVPLEAPESIVDAVEALVLRCKSHSHPGSATFDADAPNEPLRINSSQAVSTPTAR